MDNTSGSGVGLHAHQQRQHQQHDLETLLGMVLGSLEDAEEQESACALHSVSRSSRSTAISAIKHLSLPRYDLGRCKAMDLVANLEPSAIPAAAARAAAAPPMPWRLLADVAAAGVLTSLEVNAPQVQYLLTSGPAAATAAAAAAGEGPAPRWATALARLRCLRVEELSQEAPQLQQVGRLVGACSGLTQLVLAPCSNVDIKLALVGTAGAAAAAAATTAEATAGGAATGAACPASFSAAVCGLPALQCLELEGPIPGLINQLMASPAPPQLTTLRLTNWAANGVDLACLTACSGLQELEVWYYGEPGPEGPPLVLPEGLTQLRGLTKLVLDGCKMDGEVAPVVWQLTQLRHLVLEAIQGLDGPILLSDEISSLRHPTSLSLQFTWVEEVPADLGHWLPQLQELNVHGQRLDLHQFGITQFAGVTSLTGGLVNLASQQQLVGLKEVVLYQTVLEPPFDGFSRLTALEKLAIHRMEEGSVVVSSAPLPRLRSLELIADDPFRVAAQLVGSGQHLTYLKLSPTERQQGLSSIHQLKVLPVLKELSLARFSATDLVDIGPWLYQQPQLTSLCLVDVPTEVNLHLSALPPVLKYLHLPRFPGQVGAANGVLYDLPEAVAALTGLQELWGAAKQLPAWLSSLTSLRVVDLNGPESGWGVLGQLPLLRRLEPYPVEARAVVLCAPHLCWPIW